MTTDAPDPAPPDLASSSMPLCAHLGVRTDRLDPEEVVLALDWRPELCTIGGGLHGGTLMMLADSAGAVCAYLNLGADATGTTTIESKTNFFRRVDDGTVVAVSRPLHVGRSTIVVETELRHGDRLVAKTTQTQAVISGRPAPG